MSTPTYRVLVTGSRDWTDRQAVENTLTTAGALAVALGQRLTVVHGACRTGADAIAEEWVTWHRDRGRPFATEPHRAEDHGPWPQCGPIRNRHMVSLGADACFAFIGPCSSKRCRRTDPHPSHGASGCADMAQAAGIPTRRWPQ